MATKYVGDKGGIAAWRAAHDAVGALLEAAEEADGDAGGKVPVDFAACRDGYDQLCGMFASRGADADPADEDRDAAFARARDGQVDHRRNLAPGRARATTADSRRGMAQDRRRRAAVLPDLDEVFPQTPQRGSANARVRVSELHDIFAPVSP
jgi:hypothetical protein